MSAFDLTDKINDAINTQVYQQSFTSSVKIPVQERLEDIKDLTVRVFPTQHDTINQSRGYDKNTIQVSVGIQKKLNIQDIDAATRELHDLAIEIKDSIRRVNIPPYCYLSSTIAPVFDVGQLVENQVFTSVIILTYEELSRV